MSYKRCLMAAISLFGIGIALGLAFQASIAKLFAQELGNLEQLSGILAPFSVAMALTVFVKNTVALVTSFVLSPVFCLAPITALIVNGGLIAFVSSVVVTEKSLGFLLAGLLPHGIFELPALIIGEAAALSFGTLAVVALFKKESRQLLAPSLKKNVRYLMVALALLVPAAIVETYITPLLLG